MNGILPPIRNRDSERNSEALRGPVTSNLRPLARVLLTLSDRIELQHAVNLLPRTMPHGRWHAHRNPSSQRIPGSPFWRGWGTVSDDRTRCLYGVSNLSLNPYILSNSFGSHDDWRNAR